MRVVHLLRKPLSEGTVAANTLKHGCGGLNIDASRVHSGPSSGGSISGATALGQASGWNAHANRTTQIDRSMSAGRWPANLILQHLDGCRCEGVKRVKGTGPRAGGSGSRFKDPGNLLSRKGHEGVRTDHAGYAGPEGKETVANWICEPGCPVAALEKQSGTSRFFKQIGGNHEGTP